MPSRDIFSGKYSKEKWLIKEDGWSPELQQVRETQFTQGNGFICCRGVLEDIPYDSSPGTYIAGLFDRTGAQIPEIVNLPNPINFRIDVYGEKLDPVAMDIMKHERTLDIKNGTLYRTTLYRTTHDKRILYQSQRFISMHDKNSGFIEIYLTPLDADMTVNVQTLIDSHVSNKGALTEGRKRHFQTIDVAMKDNISYRCVQTFEKGTLITYATSLEICSKNRCKLVADRAMKMRVKKDETIIFRKLFVINQFAPGNLTKVRNNTINILKKIRTKGIDQLVEENKNAWDKKWLNASVKIDGDMEAMRALRFNLYHLIIAGSEDNDNVSIGARTLSGEGYRGHVFWDAEVFVVPFFIYCFPDIAKNQLLYRYHRLKAAKDNAAAKGYDGALFPWESADTGEECTPSWHKNYDGKIIQIVTMDQEHHLVADIAHTIYQYCLVTKDDLFMWKYGLEMFIETARFWASRVTLNQKKKRYEIENVMGPDEFHEGVNNNAYTNSMARWNLQTAHNWYRQVKERHPKQLASLAKRVKLREVEVERWRKIANKIYIPYSKSRGLIEAFDGYFKLKDIRITQLNESFMPVVPSSVKWESIGKTQLIKQADVVMLLYLLGHQFDFKTKKRNYYYYERRTLHKSSLSPSIHAIVGLEVGDYKKVLHYFSNSLATDLNNTHGNTSEGIHAASSGGVWQSMIFGFCGVRTRENFLEMTPHFPGAWRAVKFRIWWRGARLYVSLRKNQADVTIEYQKKKMERGVRVFGKTKKIEFKKTVSFRQKR